MSIEIVADLTEVIPSSPEWLKLRKLGIGGSDAGAICGVNTRRTPYEVWAEKVNPTVPEWNDEPEYMTWGKLLEAPVREEFSRRTGIEVHPLPKMIRSVEHPWMLANVDGVTGPAEKLTGAYEGKTTRRAQDWAINDDGSVNVPLPYMVQGMHYLAVLDQLEVIHYACLIGGQELRIAEVQRDENLIADLIEIEENFWRSVTNREPPPVSGGDVGVLKGRWKPTAGKSIALPDSFSKELKRRAEYADVATNAKAAMDEIDAQVMAAMGDAEEATLGGQVVVTWKSTVRKTVDTKALRAEHPEVAAAYTVANESRRFLPKTIDTEDEEVQP